MRVLLYQRQLLKSGLIVAWASLLWACSKPVVSVEPVRSVKLMTVGLQPMQATQDYAAEVRARVESRLGFRVAGKLTERTAELGQHVRAGQLLAQLDPQDLKLGLAAARAQVAAARSNRDLAAADLQRYRSLKEQNFIGAAELERRDAQAQAAQAQLDQAQSQLSAQSNQAAYAMLRADVPGVVTGVLAERGQVLAAGNPVLQIAQDGPRDVVFAVPEDRLATIQPGAAVLVRAWSANQSLPAVVREIAASADPVTRTFTVKVALRRQDDLPLGSTVTVRPTGGQTLGTPVLKLPTSALFQQGQSSAVWVLDASSMTVKPQPVQIASVDGNEVVIHSGLQPGTQVVVTGVHVLTDGQKVKIFKQNMPVALADPSSNATENRASNPPIAAASAN